MQINVNIEAEFLASIVQGSSEISSEILDFVEPGFFSVDSYQWLVKKLKDRKWEKTTFEFIDQLILEDIKDQEKNQLYRTQIYGIFVRELSYEKDAVKKFKTFIAHSIVKASTKTAFDSFEKSSRIDFMLNELKESHQKAEQLIKEESFAIIDYAENYKERRDKRLRERDNPDISPIIKTGIRGLDIQFEIKAPMIVDFFAPFKRYKSVVLNSMGFSALLQGFNVLQVVYENTNELTADRHDSLFSEISYDRIVSMAITDEERTRIDLMFSWINSWESRMKIMKCKPNETTIPEIEEQIDKLRVKQGFKPDVVIIDYLNIIAPSKRNTQERLEQRTIVWDMKHLADTYKVPIITATQANMEGADVERLKMIHRGKSIDISQGVNLSIAINQTKEERDEGLLVFSPLFSRESDITIPEVVVDCDMNRMCISRELSEMWRMASKNFPYSS